MRGIALFPPSSFEPAPLDPRGAADLATEVRATSNADAAVVAEAIPPAASVLHERGVRLVGRFGVGSQGECATLSAAVTELSAPGDGFVPEHGIGALREERRALRPYADTRRVDLPAGPAVASLVFGQFDFPLEEAGADDTVTVPTFRAELLIPTPEWDGIVVLDVSTTDETAWSDVAPEAVRIARSLRFLDDGEPAREGELLLRL